METFSNNTSFKLAIVVALFASILLIWISLGVGIIGQDGHPANLMYFAVIAVGLIGAVLTRLRSAGMERVMLLMALVQGIIAIIALAAGLGMPFSPPLEILGLNLFFIALFAASAWLFRQAAQNKPVKQTIQD